MTTLQRILRILIPAALGAVALAACNLDNVPPPRIVLEQMSPVTCTSTSGSYACSSEVGMIVLQGQIPLSEILVAVSGAGVSRSLFGTSPVNDLQATYFVQVTNSASTCTAASSVLANVYAEVIGTSYLPLATSAGQFSASTSCQ